MNVLETWNPDSKSLSRWGSIQDRLEKRIDRSDGQAGCWEWTGRRSSEGYGVIYLGRPLTAHRVAYEVWVLPVGPDEVIDHLCRNRGCVNPDHLESVSNQVNVLRGDGLAARNARKRFCKRGHCFDQENTYVDPIRGHRQCRSCRREYMRKRRAHG